MESRMGNAILQQPHLSYAFYSLHWYLMAVTLSLWIPSIIHSNTEWHWTWMLLAVSVELEIGHLLWHLMCMVRWLFLHLVLMLMKTHLYPSHTTMVYWKFLASFSRRIALRHWQMLVYLLLMTCVVLSIVMGLLYYAINSLPRFFLTPMERTYWNTMRMLFLM